MMRVPIEFPVGVVVMHAGLMEGLETHELKTCIVSLVPQRNQEAITTHLG
jgi:hypothetical protein